MKQTIGPGHDADDATATTVLYRQSRRHRRVGDLRRYYLSRFFVQDNM